MQAVRKGRFKLYLPRSEDMFGWWEGDRVEFAAYRLYDLVGDQREENNIAAEQPEVVKGLLAAAARVRAELGSFDRQGSQQKSIEHLLGDRHNLRQLRTQQGHDD